MKQFVVLIRHAQTDYRKDRLAGSIPGVGLSPVGEQQAAALGERLRRVKLKAIYTSPLERCQRTAAAVAEGRAIEPTIDPALSEADFGTWEDKSYAVLRRTKMWWRVQYVPSQATFPKGETVRAMQGRCVEAVERLRSAHPTGVIAVVSHADTIKAVTAHYLGMHLDMFQRIVIANASATVIGFGEDFPRVLRMSDTGQMDELGA